jgi:hypothetical protein
MPHITLPNGAKIYTYRDEIEPASFDHSLVVAVPARVMTGEARDYRADLIP